MAWSMNARIGTLSLREPVIVPETETLRSLARTLWLEDVGAVVVRDGAGPIGIVSERDLVNRVAHGEDLDVVTAGQAMTTRLIAARPGDTAHDAAYQMLQYGIRHLPVLDDAGQVVGMISIRDLLRPVVTDEMDKPVA